MLVQEQSLHSLDLTDLDLDKEETKKEGGGGGATEPMDTSEPMEEAS